MRRALIALALLAACSRADEDSKTRTMQQPAPPRAVEIPAGLSIDVVVDGTAKPAITTERLTALAPDFADTERRAWRISKLQPEASAPGAIVEASSPANVSVKYPHGDGGEPVLYLTRRGELAVASLDPKDPFPKFHGQGSRLRRPGDQLPHVLPVSRLTISTHAGSGSGSN